MSLSFRTVLPSISPIAALSSVPICASPYCPRPATLWQRWWARHEGVWLHESWYCSVECFQFALFRQLQTEGGARRHSGPQPQLVPLGLVLLSQGAISSSQLRQALQLQKTTRSGKIGEWLVRMGAVSEAQITAGLAVQQRCPVFADREPHLLPDELHWPMALVQRYRAVPVFHNSAAQTLYVGFLEQVDHAFLYSLEHVLHCRTKPCIVPLATYRQKLEVTGFSSPGETIEIQQRQDSGELTQTVAAYAQQVRAEQCSMAFCGERLWIRLESAMGAYVDFLFRMPAAAS